MSTGWTTRKSGRARMTSGRCEVEFDIYSFVSGWMACALFYSTLRLIAAFWPRRERDPSA